MTDQPPHHIAAPPRFQSAPALPTVEQLCERYGAALLDYTRLWLADTSRAADAVRETLALAHQHAHRLTHPDQLRAWLYALARHQAAHCDDSHAFSTSPLPAVPSSAVPSPADPSAGPGLTGARLAYDALSALDRRDRELLELHLRHRLEASELAALFATDPAAITTALTAATDLVEAWASAIRQADRQNPACPEVATLAHGWITTPSRGIRIKIRSHVGRCPICAKAANLTVDATALLQHLPVAQLTDRTRARILQTGDAVQTPLTWTVTGFPQQIDQLELGPARPVDPALDGFRANAGKDFWADSDHADRAFWTDEPAAVTEARFTEAATPGKKSPRDVLISLSARPLRAARSTALTAAALVICIIVGMQLSQPAPVQTTSARYPEPLAVPSQDPLPPETAPPPPPTTLTSHTPTAAPTTSAPPAPTKRPRATPKRPTSSPIPARREVNGSSPRPRSSNLPDTGPGQPPPPPSTGRDFGSGTGTTLSASSTTVDLDASGTATVTLTASGSLTWSASSPALQLLPASGALSSGQSSTLQILSPMTDPTRIDYGACAASAHPLTVTWSTAGSTGQLTIVVRTPSCG
ncbi:hypothetical protein AB0D67_29005 [Streptosporangium sp. NPDC048047]|uniref:hypothetical protein n=1 Tax=Streptosporangium sp. NPDC048047 TaxID=3155748 RepID=UPI0034165E33